MSHTTVARWVFKKEKTDLDKKKSNLTASSINVAALGEEAPNINSSDLTLNIQYDTSYLFPYHICERFLSELSFDILHFKFKNLHKYLGRTLGIGNTA